MRLMRSVLLLSLSVAAISPSSSNAQDLLRWKLNRGETLNYTVQQKMEMSVNVAGTDVTNTINQKMGMVWNISEIAASGDVIMNQVINRIQLRMENSQTGTAEFDTQDPTPPGNPLMKAMADTFGNIVGKEFTVTMKPTGKVDEVSIPKELLDAIRNSSAGVPGSLDTKPL
ncbi:MAG: DUF6263 family protein [Planctomycetaceae bacterium]